MPKSLWLSHPICPGHVLRKNLWNSKVRVTPAKRVPRASIWMMWLRDSLHIGWSAHDELATTQLGGIMDKMTKFAAVVLLSAVSTPALAQDNQGFYAGVRIGLASTNDVDVIYGDEGGTFGGTGATDTAEFTANLDSAIAIGGVVGYDFGVVRTDLEVDYSQNKVSGLTINRVNGQPITLTPADATDICDYLETDECSVTGNTIATDGRLRQLSAIANLWVDLPIGPVTPYAGGGLGMTGYEIDGEGDVRFSWQVGAGVALDVSSTMVVSVDVRHRQATGILITDSEFPDFSIEIDDVRTTTFSAGLRFRF